MLFLNSVDDVDGVSGALREYVRVHVKLFRLFCFLLATLESHSTLHSRVGIENVLYYAKIKLDEGAENLDRFCRYSVDGENDNAVSVLVCTDLASPGLDVSGVTAIVQLWFAGNVVAHLHRTGRCGRAGNRNGRGIEFYGEEEREELVEVVRDAEFQQERMLLEGR